MCRVAQETQQAQQTSVYFTGVSRHTVVCHEAQETWHAWQTTVYFTGVKKMPFLHICSSTVPGQKDTKFFVWISLGWSTSNSKFELNLPSRSRDIRLQSSSYFLLLFPNTFWNYYNSCLFWWIALKFGALLEHIRAYLRFNFCSNGIETVIIVFQNFQVPRLQVKPLTWISWKSICSWIKHLRNAF